MEEPAFPSILPGSMLEHPGMTLRDWLAGQALAGFAASPHCSPTIWDDRSVATCCYEVADALLAARKTQGEQS